jgi:hypothetical protein
MKNQAICNVYDSAKALEEGIQYYMDLYGNSAKVVVKTCPTFSYLTNEMTAFLLTVTIFEKHNFNQTQGEEK